MWKITLCLVVAVIVLGFASCSITCPDRSVCSDFNTCCKTRYGYSCCPYPKAVCCSDLAYCCPSQFSCNMATLMCEKQNQPWMNIPMVNKVAVEEQTNLVQLASDLQELINNRVADQQKSSVVYCDAYTYCPDGTTCCRHPAGAWFCCVYYAGKCCLDGYHCCPYGYNCDLTYTHCVRQGLTYPFFRKHVLSSVPAALISPPEDKRILQETPMTRLTEASVSIHEAGVIPCDNTFYCKEGTKCCNGPMGQWNCCPYKLGQCCDDGLHCCENGYTCEPNSLSCTKLSSEIPSEAQERHQTI